MYHGDPRPEDQATDIAMAAFYRQLDNHGLSTDTPFDVQAGLQRLTDRIRRELGKEPEPPAPRAHLPARNPPHPARVGYATQADGLT
jgi:hypothetical protein